MISGEVHFGVIPHDHWYQPDWIDEERAKKGRQELVRNKVIYGGTSFLCPLLHESLLMCMNVLYRQRLVPQHVPFQLGLLLPPRAPQALQVVLARRVSYSLPCFLSYPGAPLHALAPCSLRVRRTMRALATPFPTRAIIGDLSTRLFVMLHCVIPSTARRVGGR